MDMGETISEFLGGGLAYTSIKKALTGIQPKNRFIRPDGAPHSIFEELEHMRIAQEDILRYTLDPKWKSPDWPGGFWPDPHKRQDGAAWTSCVKRFLAGLDECKAMARNQEMELTAEIPHGEGRTYLRQLLLVAEHNSYHLGQIVLIRKLLKDWTE